MKFLDLLASALCVVVSLCSFLLNDIVSYNFFYTRFDFRELLLLLHCWAGSEKAESNSLFVRIETEESR